jgi:hypothetical protein
MHKEHAMTQNHDVEALQNEAGLLAVQHDALKNAYTESLSMVTVGTVQTRSRDEMHDYIKAVAAYYFGSMTGFHKVILKYYLEEQPWKYPGWVWATPQSTYIYAGGITTPNPGWCQYNITVPVDILKTARRVHREIKAAQPKVSLAAFLYTMLIWGIANYFPPKKRGIAGPDVNGAPRRALN